MFPSISRRQLLILAGSAAVIAACGDDEPAADDTASADVGGADEGSTDAVTSTTPPPAAATAAPATTTGATSDAATHVLTDEFGEVEVPVAPQRVVFMDATTLGNAVALGFPADRIAGVAFGADLDPAEWYGYLADDIDLAALTNVGELAEPNLEAIAAVNPDVIVVLSMWDEVRDELLKLGVPVYTALNGYNSVDEMMELLRDCGDVLGLRPQADELETQFRGRVDGIVAKFEGERPSVNAVRVFDEADIWIQAHPLFDLMEMPRVSPAPPTLFEQLSSEQLTKADADLLWASGSLGIDETQRILEGHPLWPSMNAVTTGMVRYVEDSPWGTDYSYPALVVNLDEIDAGLTAFLESR